MIFQQFNGAEGNALEDGAAGLLRRVKLRLEFLRRCPPRLQERRAAARRQSPRPGGPPRLVVAEEVVTALDVSVQERTLNLLRDLPDKFKLTCLFTAHDLSVIEPVSDRVAMTFVGRIVDPAQTNALFASPRHPYIAALLAAVQVLCSGQPAGSG